MDPPVREFDKENQPAAGDGVHPAQMLEDMVESDEADDIMTLSERTLHGPGSPVNGEEQMEVHGPARNPLIPSTTPQHNDTVQPPALQPLAIADHRSADENRSSYQSEAVDDPDDHYRPEGTLMLDIDHFTDFVRGPPEVQQRLSRSIYVRGIPWKILAIPREQCRSNRNTKALGFFLQCNGDSEQLAWSCIAHATLKVLSKKEGIDDHQRRISHTFYPKENDWGYSQFLSCDHLANPEHGFIDNDCVSLVVHVAADAPHGVQWDSKRHTGYIGLKNQGATCYMNSILQTLFFTSQLRRAVYEMPTMEDDSESSVALAMQRVFYDLQHSDKPVGTKKLTKSFGWDSFDSFLQHDVQELCRVLLDNLESKMKSTNVEDMIPRLFKGKMLSYIKCTEVDFRSERLEVFYDVQLNVRPKNDIGVSARESNERRFNVIDSFRDYVEPERLDGDNKYDAGQYGHQPALKGVRFVTFPPVLHLQLMRFQYDGNIDANVKVNERFEFPDLLDLNEFVADRGDEDYTYCLHAVLVHSGDFHGGHYVVFINTDLKSPTSRWCKFDDDVVSRSTFRDSVTANYGGDDAEVLGRTFTNAYMLVYVQRSAISDVLCTITDADIPLHLKERFEAEKEEEARKKKEKMEAHLFMDVYLLTDAQLATHHSFDLFDMKTIDEMATHERIEKAMTVQQFFDFVGRKCINPEHKRAFPTSDFRLWQFVENAIREECAHGMSLPRMRAYQQIIRSAETAGKRIDEILEIDKAIIFVELPTLQPDGVVRLADYNEKTDMLMFLKYFNQKAKELVYCGHIMLNYKQTLDLIVGECCNRAMLPPGTKLRFYEEVSPDRIRAIESLSMPLCSEYMLCEVNDGGILIFERIDETTIKDNAQTFLEDRYSSIEVEALQNPDNTQFPHAIIDKDDTGFTGVVSLKWSATLVAEWIAKHINWESSMLLLWRVSPFHEKPTQFIVDAQLKCIHVKELLSLVGDHVHDPRKAKKYRLFYNKIPCPVSDMDKRRQMRVTLMDDKFQLSDVCVYPDRNGTVSSILEEARRIFKFSANGSGILRLVYVGNSPHCRRVYQIFSNDEPVMGVYQKILTPTVYTVRVEEIPVDQVDIGPNDYLLPVAHFDKDPQSRMFGVPFYIKVTHGEALQSVRARLRERLDVTEKEFEKYKFALLSGTRVVRYLDMDSDNQVNLAELGHTHVTNTNAQSTTTIPYLGLDHFNRSRTARGGHTTEKAIIIHN